MALPDSTRLPGRLPRGIPILLSLAIPLAAVPVAAAPGDASPAQGSPPVTLCIVRSAGIEGLEPALLEPALGLEARKAGRRLECLPGESRDACPPGPDRLVLLLMPGPSVSVIDGTRAEWPLDLAGLDAPDRAQDVARRVVALGLAQGKVTGEPLVSEVLARWPSAAIRPPGPAVRAGRALQGYLIVQGAWRYESSARLHAGSAGLEGGVSLYGERLQAGALLAWQPVRSMHPGSPSRC